MIRSYFGGYNLCRQTMTDQQVADHCAGTTRSSTTEVLFVNQESSKLHIFRVKWQIPEAASIIEDSDAGGVIELCQESRLYVAHEGVRIRDLEFQGSEIDATFHCVKLVTYATFCNFLRVRVHNLLCYVRHARSSPPIAYVLRSS